MGKARKGDRKAKRKRERQRETILTIRYVSVEGVSFYLHGRI